MIVYIPKNSCTKDGWKSLMYSANEVTPDSDWFHLMSLDRSNKGQCSGEYLKLHFFKMDIREKLVRFIYDIPDKVLIV